MRRVAGWIEDAVALAVVAISHQRSLHCLEFELLGICFDMNNGSGTNDSKKPQIGLHPVQHLGDYMQIA